MSELEKKESILNKYFFTEKLLRIMKNMFDDYVADYMKDDISILDYYLKERLKICISINELKIIKYGKQYRCIFNTHLIKSGQFIYLIFKITQNQYSKLSKDYNLLLNDFDGIIQSCVYIYIIYVHTCFFCL